MAVFQKKERKKRMERVNKMHTEAKERETEHGRRQAKIKRNEKN